MRPVVGFTLLFWTSEQQKSQKENLKKSKMQTKYQKESFKKN